MQQLEMDIVNDVNKLDRMHGDLSITTRIRLDQFSSTLRPSTRMVYRSTLINFLHRISSSNPLFLRQYNIGQWQQYVNEYLSSFSPKTINNKAYAVKAFFDYLVSIGERRNNPLDEFKWLKETDTNDKRVELSWNQINMLKHTLKYKTYKVFKWGYYEGKKISETGQNGTYIDYHAKLMGKQIGIDNLKYSDITAARKRFFAKCPVTGEELEMSEENWMFKDGLLQVKLIRGTSE